MALSLTTADDGSRRSVDVGDRVTVSLPENPTTGYRWQLRSSGEPVLEVQDDSFQTAAGPPGAGGVRRWRFRAGQEGTADLEIDYQRSWEKRAAQTFRLRVRVKPR